MDYFGDVLSGDVTCLKMGFGSTRALADGSGYRNTIRGGVEIRISMKEIERRMRRMRDKLPKLRERAFKVQMGTILKQMQKAMASGGGVYGVPRFKEYESFTKDLRKAYGRDANGPIGGNLANKHMFRYDALTPFSSTRPKVRIGWLKGCEDSAMKFQLGQGNTPDPFTDRQQRHQWHRVLATDELPDHYVHNQRQLIIPFERHVTENLQKWIDGYVRKTLANKIARETRSRMR